MKNNLLLYNGTIYPQSYLPQSISNLLIKEGKVHSLNLSSEQVQHTLKTTPGLDLQGQFVFPGFIESHGHLIGTGKMKMILDLSQTQSYEEALDLIKNEINTKKKNNDLTPIIGRGWDHYRWKMSTLPDNTALNELSSQHAIVLTRIDGHAILANSKALSKRGITNTTTNPQGGEILRDKQGRATGILIDTAMDFMDPFLPTNNLENEHKALQYGAKECLKHGITSFHDAGSDLAQIGLYEQLHKKKELPLRLYVMVNGLKPHQLTEQMKRGAVFTKDNFLTIRALKLFADGALGSCGAHLSEAYLSRPHSKGLCLLDEKDLTYWALEAFQAGFQVCTHAIGDAANHHVLNAYEKVICNKQKENHRFRVEHAQLIREEDIPRFAKNGIIASIQATHCTSDMKWLHRHIHPERAKKMASPWKSLLNSGAVLAGGTDTPIENLNPFKTLYASVTRQDEQGYPEGGWNSHHALNLQESFKSLSLNAAYSSFQEETLGELIPGKWADFFITSQDPYCLQAKDLLTTKVSATYLAGKKVYTETG